MVLPTTIKEATTYLNRIKKERDKKESNPSTQESDSPAKNLRNKLEQRYPEEEQKEEQEEQEEEQKEEQKEEHQEGNKQAQDTETT